VTCLSDNFSKVRDELIKVLKDPIKATLIWQPINYNNLCSDGSKSVMKLIDNLEDNDDVQNVFSNALFCSETMLKLETL
jgi:transcriptional/translational regulatory protein YebC/TACO1